MIKEMHLGGRSFSSHWRNAKRVIGDGWNGAVKLAGQFDQGMRVGRKLFGALQPALDQFAAPEHQKTIMAGFKQYDSTRSDIMNGYNQVEQAHNRIKRQVPELDL